MPKNSANFCWDHRAQTVADRSHRRAVLSGSVCRQSGKRTTIHGHPPPRSILDSGTHFEQYNDIFGNQQYFRRGFGGFERDQHSKNINAGKFKIGLPMLDIAFLLLSI